MSVFMALSTVFHSMNYPDNSPFSHSVLPVFSLPYWSFQLYVSLWKSPCAEYLGDRLEFVFSPDVTPSSWLRSTHQLTKSPHVQLHVLRMLQFMSDINHPNLPTPFYFVLVSISVFLAFPAAFHSINSRYYSPYSHSVRLVLSLPYWYFYLYVSLWKSPSALI